MPILAQMLKRMPLKFKRALRNRFTLGVHRYLVSRPVYLNSVVTGITIELTDRCNLSCSYCPKSLGIGGLGGNMDYDLFKRIVDQACALAPIQQIVLVGYGEPLLYPHLLEAIRYIKAKNKTIRVSLTSNGVLLSADWARRLVDEGLDQITISVNATSRQRYLDINRVDLYDKVVSNTCEFINTVNASASAMRILVQVLETLNNKGEIAAFRAFWQPKLGRCGEIQTQPFVNWAGTLEGDHTERPVANREPYPCAHLQTSWIITREGNALACCMIFPDDQGDLALGNVKEKSLEQLYMEGKILELRRKNQEGTLYQLEPCKNCDAYRTVPNVWIRSPLYPRFHGKKWL